MVVTTPKIVFVPVYIGNPPILEAVLEDLGINKKVTINCPYCYGKHSHYLYAGMEDDMHFIQREAPCMKGEHNEYKIHVKREK